MAVRVPPHLCNRDAATLAPAAGLAHVTTDQPGIGRRRRGTSFTYTDAFGKKVSKRDLARIEALVIPPAWKQVWICPVADGYLQATGVDEAGRTQYRYHEDYREFCEAQKFERLAYFGRGIVVLRKAMAAALDEPVGHRDHAVAAALRLIDECLLRVGNHQSADKGHYGATTLTVEHVVSDGEVVLEYIAKSGKERTILIEDEDLAELLTELAADADDELFWFDVDGGGRRRATASDVNRFIEEHAGDAFSARDFRTWGGSSVALAARASGERLLDAIDAAAEELGNTRSVARSSYIHPAVQQATDDEIDAVWSSSRSSRWLDRSESALAKLIAG